MLKQVPSQQFTLSHSIKRLKNTHDIYVRDKNSLTRALPVQTLRDLQFSHFHSQVFDDVIFIFFSLEMTIKLIAMSGWGKGTYLADSWNRLDFFIVMSGAFEYFSPSENLNLTAIRTIRVLRPLRAINRIPSEYEIFLSHEVYFEII